MAVIQVMLILQNGAFMVPPATAKPNTYAYLYSAWICDYRYF